MTATSQMTAPVALLACPFCGEVPAVTYDEHPRTGAYWTVICDNGACPCASVYADKPTEAEAIAAWNTRPAQPAASEVVEVTVDMEDAAMRAYYDAISGEGAWEKALPTMPMHANATFRERIHAALKSALGGGANG